MTRLRYVMLTTALVLAAACGAAESEPPMDETAAPAPDTEPVIGEIQRLDPRIDALIPTDARIEKLAEGFNFAEGPVWDPLLCVGRDDERRLAAA